MDLSSSVPKCFFFTFAIAVVIVSCIHCRSRPHQRFIVCTGCTLHARHTRVGIGCTHVSRSRQCCRLWLLSSVLYWLGWLYFDVVLFRVFPYCFSGFLPLGSKYRCSFSRVPLVSSVSSGLRNCLMSSSHLFFGLPTPLLPFAPMLSPGFHFAAFFVHPDSGCDAILTANLYSIFFEFLSNTECWLPSSCPLHLLCLF